MRAIASAIQAPDVGGVAGSIEAFRVDSPVERYQARLSIRADRAYHHKVLPFAQTANAAYKREVFERIGLFDPSLIFGGDLDFSWRMQSGPGLRLVYEALAVVWHRHRVQSPLVRRFIEIARGQSRGQAAGVRRQGSGFRVQQTR